MFAAISILILMATLSTAQEESVRPGVNDSYRDADPGAWVQRLEAEDRAIYAYRHAIVAALGIGPGDEVADVGAGTGFLTRLIAQTVGNEGRVYAVDITPTFLEHIAEKAAAEGLVSITTVLAEPDDTKLAPGSVDLVLVCDTYHHFEYPLRSTASIHKALRPGGRLVVIDFERIFGVSTSFAVSHVRAGKGTVTDEIKDSGFDLVRELPLMTGEGQYYLEFVRRD